MFEGINNKKIKILDELGVNNLIETKGFTSFLGPRSKLGLGKLGPVILLAG